ncbi:siroheme synthase CysG [Tropicimonas isoalkanivorans]|uniref:Uroporphyrinogen-III C-methyltransferase n=1 Tax=Tropicimonas isoalkanivorans TaxID=441112 RepID=A0A1I1FXW6_9RHOB|nr:siroheme synthase CysG [Tropicimonas isoalkanivorans]SFC04429.1 uroporphyrinogen-III C-methyltransferase [Tropicimonas isoalkanivorans]
MQHFPIFLDTAARRVVLCGGGEAALAKLRLLLKSQASLHVFAEDPASEIVTWAEAGLLDLHRRTPSAEDLSGAALVYAAQEDADADARLAGLARAQGVLVNIVDNLEDSDFITPAIVDRDPVTVAIGTEGAAPVLARAIKRDLEERLPQSLGLLARIGKAFRPRAEVLPHGRRRRDFWSDYYFTSGPRAAERSPDLVEMELEALLKRHARVEAQPGHVHFVGAGPGDPDLLTLKARRALDEADVVIHDRLVPKEILELARREAVLVSVGKEGFGPSTPQGEIDALLVEHANSGAQVVRLKSGDPSVFGRLDEELAAVEAAGVAFTIVPGITAASAAAAQIGQSLTARGRNSEMRLLTGHDVKGFAEQEWHALARPGAVAAVYMGKRAARFLQGRLLMHGAVPETPVAIVENASRPDARIVASRLGSLSDDIAAAELSGPAVILLGLAPRAARVALPRFDTVQKEFA